MRFAEMKAVSQSFTAIGAFTSEENLTITGGGQPEVLKAALWLIKRTVVRFDGPFLA